MGLEDGTFLGFLWASLVYSSPIFVILLLMVLIGK